MTLSTPNAREASQETYTDQELAIRAQEGERTALEELTLRHRKAVYLLGLQLLGDPEDAMDATQETFLRFIGSLERFDPGRPVRPWLYAILRNRVRDLRRRRRVRKWEPLEGDDGRWRPELVDPSADPRRRARRSELRERVWRALATLSVQHREIVVLRDYQDLSYEEIAGVLGIPKGTVMSRLHRARKHLASALRPSGQTEGSGG